MRSPFPGFCLGLLLGGAATWFALRAPAAAPRSDAAPSAPRPAVLAAWSWRDSATPPLLARDESAAAVSAWLALRGPGGGAPSYALRAASLRALVLRLPAEGFSRLVEGLASSDKDEDQRLLRIAFTAWTTKDPAASTRWVATRVGADSDERFYSLAREALESWSARDAVAAAVWASSLPDLKIARQFAGLALAGLAAKDPARALALAHSRDNAFRDAVLPDMLEVLGKSDPAGTLRTFAPELWKNGEGFYSLRPLISAWMKQDSHAALAWLLTQPAGEGQEVSYWFANLGDGSAAWRRTVADAVASTPGIVNRARALRDLLFQWGNDKPDEALAWLKDLPDADLRITLLERAANGYYTDNPEKSLPLALAMPAGANRTDRLAMLLGAWAKNNSEAALAWMREHGSEPGVAKAAYAVHGALLADLAREDPQAALAEWQALSDPDIRSATILDLARAWGQKDPAAAVKWAEAEQAATPSRRVYGGYNDLLYKWARAEPEAALRWVEDWAAGRSEGDRFFISDYLDALGGTWAEKAPRAGTADLYTRIRDPKLRLETLARHVNEWLTKDPAAARAWVESNAALTPADRKALLPAGP